MEDRMHSLSKYVLFKIVSVTVLLPVLIGVSSCARTDKEEQLYQLIKQGVELAEGHDLSGLMDLTKDEFVARPGDRPKQEVRQILFVTFKRFGRFRIHYPKPVITVSEDGESAIVRMTFLMASQDQVFPELKLLYEDAVAWMEKVDKRTDLYAISMELEYESNNWFVTKARISRFSNPGGRL
jgi:hypothetical protein